MISAEDYIQENYSSVPFELDDITKMMVEFAQLHVTEALKMASEKAEVLMVDNCSDHTPYRGECGNCGSYHTYKVASEEINKDSILNAYPLENIK